MELSDEDYKQNRQAYIVEKLKLATQDGYAKIWKTTTNEPIAILGAHKVSDKKFGTFFVASKRSSPNGIEFRTR